MDKRKLWSTVGFVVVVGAVVGTFAFLGAQERAPASPAGPQHTLRFNLKGELIGVESDPAVDPLQASQHQAGFKYDLKAVEKRINTGCQACHGAPATDLSAHPCRTAGKCIPDHHPPKTECIKCHRQARSEP